MLFRPIREKEAKDMVTIRKFNDMKIPSWQVEEKHKRIARERAWFKTKIKNYGQPTDN